MSEWMKCTKLLNKPSTDFGGSVECPNFVMDECTKSANFLQSLNMNTAESTLCQLKERKLCVTSETHVDVVVLVVQFVRVFSSLVCMKVLMLPFIKLCCIRCRCL